MCLSGWRTTVARRDEPLLALREFEVDEDGTLRAPYWSDRAYPPAADGTLCVHSRARGRTVSQYGNRIKALSVIDNDAWGFYGYDAEYGESREYRVDHLENSAWALVLLEGRTQRDFGSAQVRGETMTVVALAAPERLLSKLSTRYPAIPLCPFNARIGEWDEVSVEAIFGTWRRT